MRLNHRLLILKSLLFNTIKFDNQSLRILNYHNVPEKYLYNFEKQINFYLDNFELITPKKFESDYQNKYQAKRLLLTFDDGFISLKKILPILTKYNIKAIFFVISDFVQLDNINTIKNFLENNLFLKKNNYNIEDHKNLKIKDLLEIIEMGHTIGYHTKSHLDLGKDLDTVSINEQVITSAILLEKILGNIKINHFAYPFGSFKNLSRKSFKILKNKYRFIYSGIRGKNNINNHHMGILKRDEISPEYPVQLIKAFLDGHADFYYNKYNLNLDK